ncbi:cytochrome P450 71A1-like [Curcuma longa]|uniref:cytochrome P450 71A1-like n=1 Tax=Curcuma longa TaxID=136217 RepID=UPI003D9DF512
MAVVFLFPCFLLLLWFTLKHLLPGKSHEPSLPPSPPGLPFLGNLLQLSSLPHRSLHRLALRYGPVMLIRMGQVPTLVVSTADAAQELFRCHDLAVSTRPFSKGAFKLTFDAHNISFAPYGDRWRHAKKLAVVHLLNLKRVLSFRAVRDEEVQNMIDRICAVATGGGCQVRLSEILFEYANAVVCHAAAGKETKQERTAVTYRKMMAEASVLISGFQMYDMFPALAWLGIVTGADAKIDRIRKQFDEFFAGILEEHRDRRAKRSDVVEHFVDILLSLGKDVAGDESGLEEIEIKAIASDLIAAGTDTSFVTLEWAMAELMRNPTVMRKLQDEVRRVAGGKLKVAEEDLSQMHYLKAVTKEVLRLRIPAPVLLPRETTTSFSFRGYHIPAKTRVCINAWAIARDPKTWEAPEEFRPERFLDSSVDFRGNDFQFLPFGAGRRMCPGINFAMATNEIALANLVHRFDWELPGGMNPADLDMEEAPGLTTPKKVPLCLVATPWTS